MRPELWDIQHDSGTFQDSQVSFFLLSLHAPDEAHLAAVPWVVSQRKKALPQERNSRKELIDGAAVPPCHTDSVVMVDVYHMGPGMEVQGHLGAYFFVESQR